MTQLQTPTTKKDGERHVLSVEELLDRGGALDNRTLFAELSGIMRSLRERMLSAFALTPSPSNAKYASYRAPNGACEGSLCTFRGPEIDLLVDSWMGNPATGFTNLHFNTWLGAHTRAPHLAIVLGTVPDVFFYFDFVPRADLTTDLEYLDRYYGAPANARYIAFHEHPKLRPFVSADVYMRQAISPVGLCFTAPRDAEVVSLLRTTAHAMMDQWLGWLKASEPVPQAERAALAARDMRVRRAIAERDPANSLAAKLLGEEEMRTLVKLLWGVGDDAR